MAKVERVKTGIDGLDDLTEGGFPKGSVTLITGGTGTGKTTFSVQFLVEGMKNGEKTLYISTEEPPEAIKDDSLVYGWDLRSYEDDGLFEIEYYQPSNNEYLSSDIKQKIKSEDPDRIVIDSMSVFTIYWGDTHETRRNMQDLAAMLRKSEATVLMTSEIPEDNEDALSRSGVSEFVADGVVVLYYQGLGEGDFRELEVRKMRRTDHEPGTHPINIGDGGITLEQDTAF